MIALSKRLQKTLKRCSEKEIRDLTEAMKHDKYWLGMPRKRNIIYVLALSKARILLLQGFQAKITLLGKVTVASAASPYCEPGCILALVKSGSQYVAQGVITWPAFLRIMRGNAKEIYDLLLSNNFPPYVDCSDLAQTMQASQHVSRKIKFKSLEEAVFTHVQ